ncbi:MAG: hypothetical protein JNK82_42050 [Myxococcaceae bacterium]|nr:hypothetical protein [Myxococcaceae bacterium]
MRRALLLLALVSGCAHVPHELAQARDELTLARDEAEVGAARAALELATHEYEQHGETQKMRDLTELARLRIDIANSKARKRDELAQLTAAKAELKRAAEKRAEIEQQAARLPPVPSVARRTR